MITNANVSFMYFRFIRFGMYMHSLNPFVCKSDQQYLWSTGIRVAVLVFYELPTIFSAKEVSSIHLSVNLSQNLHAIRVLRS